MTNFFQSQSLHTSQNPSTSRMPSPELLYPLSPIPFTASPESIASSSQETLQLLDILSRPLSPIPPMPNLELMGPQAEIQHPLPIRASPDRLRALANLAGGQLETMKRELVRYPDGSLHEIYPWDRDCLVRAALKQQGTAPLHLSIVKGDDYFVATYHELPHLLPLQHQRNETREIEIAPQCLHWMNLEKVYPQFQMPLPMDQVHLAEA